MQENQETHEATCCEAQEKIKAFVQELFGIYKQEKDNLIPILNEIQEKFGYIPKEAQKEVSEFLQIPMAEIYGVITFYSRFTLEPKGKYAISVCLGTACFVKGSQKIMDRLTERLNIKPGQTTENGLFSIDETRCVGACGLAPVFTVNGEVHGRATVKMLDQVLDDILEKEGINENN
jgi:NADH:ubiquinone oxidoreductase subunit E